MYNTSGDRIEIKALKLHAFHGCFDFEKKKGQDFYLDIVLWTDLSEAGKSDKLEDTINYANVTETVREAFTKKTFNLIEAAAESVASKVLINFPKVREIEVTVHKPQAPVEEEFEDINVSIKRNRHVAFIAVGSNMGDSKATIEKAKEALLAIEGCKMLKESSLITTKPYGGVEQDDFTNGLWKISTLLNPFELLGKLNEIEASLGRERLIHWGPRTIDLDIIYFDDLVIHSKRLTIPHVDMANRDFVLLPLLEVDPFIRHPLTGLRAEDMIEKIKTHA